MDDIIPSHLTNNLVVLNEFLDYVVWLQTS